MTAASNSPGSRTVTPAGRFLAELGGMCAVMCAGGGVLSFASFAVASGLGHPGLVQRAPELSAVIITAWLAVPMAAYMAVRGHGRRHNLEMTGSTIGVGLVVTGLLWSGAIAARGLPGWPGLFGLICGPACLIMIVEMLFSFDMYTGRARPHSPERPVPPARRRQGAARHLAGAGRGSQVTEGPPMKRDNPMPPPAWARHALHVLGTVGTALHGQTGFPQSDVADDFLRARRRQVAAQLAARLRHQPDSASRLLPLSEVTGTLGNRGERRLGLQSIPLATIVGTLDAQRDFDRHFRPTSNRVRDRWERLALAQRRGEPIPPIEVYRVGGQHFVEDGHHRVSIAAATHQKMIDAYVTEVLVNTPARQGNPAA